MIINELGDTQSKITAYQLAIESLPRPAMWLLAIQAREDDTTAGGVFAVLDELRMELQVRIGDLSERSNTRRNKDWDFEELSASTKDRVTAYQLAIDNLPRPAMWFMAIGRREDGTTARGVFEALDELRMDLQIRIGDLRDAPIIISTK